MNAHGLYDGSDINYYRTKDSTLPYFIEADGKLAGFVMVTDCPVTGAPETDFQIGEFFVMCRYRRLGVGKQAFFQILDAHKGEWQLVCHPKNSASVHFWNSVISEYTDGQFQLIESYPHFIYSDGTAGDLFMFNAHRKADKS